MPKAPKATVGNNKKIIHPNSRKASSLARQAHHDQKLGRQKHDRDKKLQLLGDKLTHFKDQLEDGKSDYTKKDLLELLERYLHRFDEELEQISIVNSVGGRHGNRHASRVDSIKMTLQAEKAEFESTGIEVPDLINKKNLEAFRDWDGELRLIQNLKLRKISAKDKQYYDDLEESSEGQTCQDGSSGGLAASEDICGDTSAREISSEREPLPHSEDEECDVRDSVAKHSVPMDNT